MAAGDLEEQDAPACDVSTVSKAGEHCHTSNYPLTASQYRDAYHLRTYLLTLQAGASFDALFDSVPAGELEQAMKVVMRQRESRDSRIVKVE